MGERVFSFRTRRLEQDSDVFRGEAEKREY